MVLTRQEKGQVTRTVGKIKEILEEVSANPNDYDMLKSAVDIYKLVIASLRKDLEISENMEAYWIEAASGAEK